MMAWLFVVAIVTVTTIICWRYRREEAGTR